MLVFSLNAQDDSTAVAKVPPVFDNHKQIIDMINKKKTRMAERKFTTSAGVNFTTFLDKTSDTPLRGKTKSGLVSVGYKFTPKISATVLFMRSQTKEADKDDTLEAKSRDDSFTTSIDYKLLHWLTINGSIKQKNGVTTTIMPQEPNQYARSKNVYRTPGVSLKMIFPVNKQVFIAPDVGFNRTYMYNKAYTDNTNTAQPRKTLIMDQVSVGTEVGYIHSPMVIPYVSLGCSRVTRYNTHLRSRNSYYGGVGIIGMGGVVVFDYTRSKAFKSITSNVFTLNVTAKF